MLHAPSNVTNIASVAKRVVWEPIPGSSQEIALDTRCHHTLYTGARGPGKTDTQLMRFRKRVGIGYGAFWRGIIFDQEYKNLDDLVSKSKRWFNKFQDGARFLESKADYKWVWPTGEELLFRAIKKPDDYWNYHGQEFPFIGWNELCKFANDFLYERLQSCNRSSFTPEKDSPDPEHLLLDIPLEVFATTNPYGPGHNWVKAKFIDPAPYGEVVKREVKAFDPKTQEDITVTKTQITIFGSYRENIYLSAQYIADLTSITDENVRKAWLLGDWDIVAGGALDDVWSQRRTVIKRFKIPSTWRVDRAFDWGSTHPFYVGWFAETNGEEVTLEDGTVFAPPAKSLILIHEWYGSKRVGNNEGVKMSAGDIAVGIRDREIEMLEWGWIEKQPAPGPADNQIRNVIERSTDTIEKMMADEGVRWLPCDKAKGSRKIGLELVRQRLQATKEDREAPRLYFFDHCRAAISTIPSLPRNPDDMDDVDTDAEDHPFDVVRYKCLSGSNRAAKNVRLVIAN